MSGTPSVDAVEAQFHRVIARHTTKRVQGYIMGAFREAIGNLKAANREQLEETVRDDDGLRRALLALVERWMAGESNGIRVGCGVELHRVLRDFDTPQRELAGQGTPSVGSSGEVSP